MKIKNRRITIFISVIIIVVATIFGTFKVANMKSYTRLVDSGNKYMEEKEYDKAIGLYKEALKYKKDGKVKRDMIMSNELKDYKNIYENGNFLMKRGYYLEAIEEFKRIPNDVEDIYKLSQSKIEESKESFVQLNIEKAEKHGKFKKYTEANKYLDNILKIDPKNEKANELKNQYNKKTSESSSKEKPEQKRKPLKSVLNPEKACKIVANLLDNESDNFVYEYAKPDAIDGQMYYIIHVYSKVKNHTSTIGWYYVNKDTGEVYELNLEKDEYTLLN